MSKSFHRFDQDRQWDYENGFYLTSHVTRIAKLLAHYELYKSIADLPGHVVECGVYKGASLIRFASPEGLFVVVGGATAQILQIVLLGLWLSKTGSKKMGLMLHKPSPADLAFMNGLFEAREVAPVIDRRYPLSEVAEALRYFASGQVQGKIVITM